jgi:hypothetical protein
MTVFERPRLPSLVRLLATCGSGAGGGGKEDGMPEGRRCGRATGARAGIGTDMITAGNHCGADLRRFVATGWRFEARPPGRAVIHPEGTRPKREDIR